MFLWKKAQVAINSAHLTVMASIVVTCQTYQFFLFIYVCKIDDTNEDKTNFQNDLYEVIYEQDVH